MLSSDSSTVESSKREHARPPDTVGTLTAQAPKSSLVPAECCACKCMPPALIVRTWMKRIWQKQLTTHLIYRYFVHICASTQTPELSGTLLAQQEAQLRYGTSCQAADQHNSVQWAAPRQLLGTSEQTMGNADSAARTQPTATNEVLLRSHLWASYQRDHLHLHQQAAVLIVGLDVGVVAAAPALTAQHIPPGTDAA